MIQKLSIQNFKSIKDLQLDCRRVNLFIGGPNVGKSNILEALACFALPITDEIKDLVRFNDLSNLLFDNDPSNEISLRIDETGLQISYDRGGNNIVCNFSDDRQMRFFIDGKAMSGISSRVNYSIYPYFFKTAKKFTNKRLDFLMPPDGSNLFSILQTNKHLRTLVSEFITDRGFKLTFRLATSEIQISREAENLVIAYPFEVISDTLQRILFYVSAIEATPDNASLIFEGPESNIFPYYTKLLAEKIASSAEKQYFITTHNPYFLQSIIEKTPIDDVLVNLVEMKNYQTYSTQLSQRATEEILNLASDVFLNLDKLIEE
jgi:AAA15 family ATPase/GTPase